MAETVLGAIELRLDSEGTPCLDFRVLDPDSFKTLMDTWRPNHEHTHSYVEMLKLFNAVAKEASERYTQLTKHLLAIH